MTSDLQDQLNVHVLIGPKNNKLSMSIDSDILIAFGMKLIIHSYISKLVTFPNLCIGTGL